MAGKHRSVVSSYVHRVQGLMVPWDRGLCLTGSEALMQVGCALLQFMYGPRQCCRLLPTYVGFDIAITIILLWDADAQTPLRLRCVMRQKHLNLLKLAVRQEVHHRNLTRIVGIDAGLNPTCHEDK